MHPPLRPMLLVLVVLGAALLAIPARARIVQPEAPAPPTAESGGREVPNAARPRICTWPAAFDLAAALALDACLGMKASEFLTRMTAPVRLRVEAERGAWQATRAAAKAAQANRAAAAERRRSGRKR